MARMPGAVWRPIPASSTRMAAFDIVCIHTMVGSLAGTDGYFRRIAPGVNSHFGTGSDGTIWQWVDTAYRSGANYNGNHHIISIENADLGTGFPTWDTGSADNVPAFTPAQIEANARICAWANQVHGVPLALIPDAKPGRRGIGFHRQGVPGYMVAGAEQWSTSTGKGCPGPRRIAQIPQIIARAREIVAGTPIEEDPLAGLSDGAIARLEELTNVFIPGRPGRLSGAGWDRIDETHRNTEALLQQNAGLTAAIGKLSEALAAGRDDLTADELKAAVRDALAEGVVNVDVSVRDRDPA